MIIFLLALIVLALFGRIIGDTLRVMLQVVIVFSAIVFVMVIIQRLLEVL